MNKGEIMNKASLAIGKVSLTLNRKRLSLKKRSPDILVVSGIIGVVVSAVLACKATTKAEDILSETKEELDKVHDVFESEDYSEEEYSKKDKAKDLTIIYVQTGVKLFRLYGPAIALATLSITSILAGNNILRKRNVAISAAYAAIDKTFNEYRERVRERFGYDIDQELRYNLQSKEITETVTDENGEKKEVKKVIKTPGDGESLYSRCFDETNVNWQKDADFNMTFLKQIESWATSRLRTRGFLSLNEVYDALGFKETAIGQVIGWYYDPKDNKNSGVGYVDFNIFDHSNDCKRAFLYGDERSVWLDFNVDGNILETISKRG